MKLYLVLVGLLACILHSSAIVVQVLTLDNKIISGDLLQLSETSLILRDIKDAKKKISIPCEDIVHVIFQKNDDVTISSTSVIFRDGNTIYGEITGGDDVSIEIDSLLLGKVIREIETIQEIRFQSTLANLPQIDKEKDTLYFLNKDLISGVVESIHKGYILFEHPRLGSRQEYFDKLERITFAELEPVSQNSSPNSLQAVIVGRDKTEVLGKLLRIADDCIHIKTAYEKNIRIPMTHVQYFFFKSNRIVYVSDLPKDRYMSEYIPIIGDLEKYHQNEEFLKYGAPLLQSPMLTIQPKMNSNYYSNPMKISNQLFYKGIGVITGMRVNILLQGEFQKFQTHIGIDDTSSVELQAGEPETNTCCIFQILVDQEEKFNSNVIRNNEIRQVEIPIKSAKVLTLIVKFAESDDIVYAIANWAGARLLR